MQSQNFSPGSRKLPPHALTSPWCVWRTLCDDCPSRAAAVRAAAETCVTALLRGPGVGTCPRPHDPCRCTRFSAALSACPNDLSAALSVWCTESAIQACLAWLTRHTLTMRYCLGRETASGTIGRRSPDQPVAAALSPGLRRTQKISIMMVLRADRARTARVTALAMLVGRGTRRCRWRPV